MPEPAHHRLTSARLSLGWWEWPAAREDAPLLVLVHGGRDHARSWDDVAARLAGRWRIAAPDLRGHGTSGWADGGGYQMEHYLYDLDRLMAALAVSAERPVTLVGHSLGGNVATRWTALFPERVRRLVSIEGLGPSPEMQARIEEAPPADRLRGWITALGKSEGRGLPVYSDLEAAVARLRQAHPGFAEPLARHLTVHGVVPAEGGGVRFAHDPQLLAWPAVDLTPAEKVALWQAITCPVLLVHGADSWASHPGRDGRAAHFRDARVLSLEGAGHWVQHDRLDAFVAAMEEFIG